MKINRHTIYYLSMGYLNVFLNIVLTLFMIRFLSVAEMGKVTIGKSIFQSFETSHLGTRNGFDRILPHIKDTSKLSVIFTIGVIITIISSFLYIVFWLLFGETRSIYYVFFSLTGAMSSIATLYKIYFRCFEDKSKFVLLSFWLLLLPSLSQLAFFFIWGIWGIALALLFSYTVIIIVIRLKYSIRHTFPKREDFISIIKLLFNKGFFMYLSSLVVYISTIGDRFFIQSYWGIESVGLLAIIMFFFTVISMFSTYYTEMYMSQIITTGSLRYVIKHILFIICLTGFIVFASYISIPHILSILMPKYLIYINVINICILGSIPFSVTPIINMYFQAIDRKGSIFLLRFLLTAAYIYGLVFVLKTFEKGNILYIIYLKNLFLLTVSLLSIILAILLSKIKIKSE